MEFGKIFMQSAIWRPGNGACLRAGSRARPPAETLCPQRGHAEIDPGKPLILKWLPHKIHHIP